MGDGDGDGDGAFFSSMSVAGSIDGEVARWCLVLLPCWRWLLARWSLAHCRRQVAMLMLLLHSVDDRHVSVYIDAVAGEGRR